MIPGSGFKHGSVGVFGYVVPFAEAGEGDVIVSLPGSAGLEMSTAKDILAQSYRVIELDPPGWGATPPLSATMRQRHLATILGEALAEMGVSNFSVIGTSMGGLTALWLAQQYPDRVNAVILEGPMAFAQVDDLYNPGAETMIEAIKSGEIAGYEGNYPAPPPHPKKPWADAAFFHEQMRRRFKMFRHTDHPGEQDLLLPFARSGTVPITLVLGSEDEILKPSYADTLDALVPDLAVHRIEGATHDVQNTAPDAFVDAVNNTLATRRR